MGSRGQPHRWYAFAMKTIYLVRHGESTVNVSDSYDQSFLGLTEKGRKQSEFIAERATKLPIQAIISSTMERTRETTGIISKRVPIEPEFSPVFEERHIPSSVLGKGKDDPAVKALIKTWMRTSEGHGGRVEDGENFDDLKARADEALAYLESHPAQEILVVSHGFFARVLMARMLCGPGLTGEQFQPFAHGFRSINTGLSVFRYDETDDHHPWHVLVWNDHAHLG